MAVGGDITEITYNHPNLGTGVFYPKAAEDSSYDLGGFTSSDDANSIDGSGEMIDKMNRKRWFFQVVVSWDMNGRQELEKANQLASDPVSAEWTFTHINGTVYRGSGKPVGEITGNANNATFPLKVSGGGVLKPIV